LVSKEKVCYLSFQPGFWNLEFQIMKL
jgi:hypothetical protein